MRILLSLAFLLILAVVKFHSVIVSIRDVLIDICQVFVQNIFVVKKREPFCFSKYVQITKIGSILTIVYLFMQGLILMNNFIFESLAVYFEK